MRDSLCRLVEDGRIRVGPQASSPEDGPNGAFLIRVPDTGVVLRVRASNGSRWSETGLPDPVWEHVSVALPGRMPTWDEMAFVKRLFWGYAEVVMQLHMSRQAPVDSRHFCLHLWRPLGGDLLIPPGQIL